jgi:hypothetical protein
MLYITSFWSAEEDQNSTPLFSCRLIDVRLMLSIGVSTCTTKPELPMCSPFRFDLPKDKEANARVST